MLYLISKTIRTKNPLIRTTIKFYILFKLVNEKAVTNPKHHPKIYVFSELFSNKKDNNKIINTNIIFILIDKQPYKKYLLYFIDR